MSKKNSYAALAREVERLSDVEKKLNSSRTDLGLSESKVKKLIDENKHLEIEIVRHKVRYNAFHEIYFRVLRISLVKDGLTPAEVEDALKMTYAGVFRDVDLEN